MKIVDHRKIHNKRVMAQCAAIWSFVETATGKVVQIGPSCIGGGRLKIWEPATNREETIANGAFVTPLIVSLHIDVEGVA